MGKVRSRRTKKSAVDNVGDDEDFSGTTGVVDSNVGPDEPPAFFGLVDSNELTYFHQAEQTLNLNTFSTPEERAMFVSSVFQESRGKELKLVTNQICSKLMERLILDSTLPQVHQLFNSFKGKFYQLSKQKFSSHVLETFLVRCASYLEKEILSNGFQEEYEDVEDASEAITLSMEEMFIQIIEEFKPHFNKMMLDKYASHVLRLLLLIITGKELPSSVESNSILRNSDDYKKNFQVPSSFKDQLKEILTTINSSQNCESFRELAINPIASPVIQLLIQLEGIVDKNRTIWSTIFNGDNELADPKDRSKESAFIEYLLSNNIGSHFLENAILAKRETTGIYVIQCLMEKLKNKQQLEILDQLIPIINELIVNNIDIGVKIIDCSIRNDNYEKTQIVDKFIEFFNKGSSDENNLLENILKLETSTLCSTKDDWPTSEERRRAIFYEKLMEFDSEKVLEITIDNLLSLDDEILLKFCKHGVFSHIIEKVLQLRDFIPLPKRKVLLNRLLGSNSTNLVDLACNSTGSHIVDSLWSFTFKLNMFKERIAKALFEHKDTIKSTIYGRMVWKNWNMEKYCRKFNDWKWDIKEEEKIYNEEHKNIKRASDDTLDSRERQHKRSRVRDRK
ncbi:hypothetical protein CAS74_004447 [Pichia kudriavzevii]|uniref:Nucleolar protein 9 n=1 Tax=Pichia kudriavzevii TaxID=4909 RepID=A0A1Z8JJM8_PICKU|nr:hypothetical protein CAS74_004447 [Pichia kudriavzevii]